MSLFKQKNEGFSDVKIALSNDEENTLLPNESISFFSYLKDYIKIKSNDNTEQPNNDNQSSIIKKIKSLIMIEKNYFRFIVCLAIGLVLLFWSFLFLPFVLFYPIKFVTYLSISSFLIIFSFIFLYGTDGYLELLFNEKRKKFTYVYLISVIFGFLLTIRPSMYPIALVCCGVEVIVMIIYFLSFIPGGQIGVNFILNIFESNLTNS